MPKEPNTSLEVGSLRALAHPLRLQMLSLLTGAPMSAAELARELGITQANASYHVRVLAKAGEIVDAGEQRVRGGLAKRYRYDAERVPPPRAWGGRGDSAFLEAVAGELIRRGRHADLHERSEVTDAELWVPPEVWERVVGMVHEASALVHREAQPPRAWDAVHVNMTTALFRMKDS